MAIAQMTKFMIVTHRSEAVEVLESLQQAGIAQILDAERAKVSKDWPELQVDVKRPRDIEDMVSRLGKAVSFLKDYAEKDPSVSLFSPLVSVDKKKYSEIVDGKEAIELFEAVEGVESDIERLTTEYENVSGKLDGLVPWKSMDTPVEEIGELRSASCFTGLLPHQHYDEIVAKIAELGGAVQLVGGSGNMHSCMVVCLKNVANDVQKILRSGDFEAVSFEGMSGCVSELIADCKKRLSGIEDGLDEARGKAGEIARKRLSLQILCDHYQNLLDRAITQANAPATESVVLLEGWVKKKEFKQLEKLVSGFGASSVSRIEAGEGEEPPVEIDNGGAVRPFEVITRLYGMPHSTDIDPTAFLAPFFALFFGICLTDAAYGLVMIGIAWWLLRKIKGDNRFVWMLMICSVMTVIAGALTGGWCGDMIQKFGLFNGGTPDVADTVFEKFRLSVMWFDPMKKPMHFFAISLGLGYLQIITGIAVGCIHKFRRGDIEGAVFDHLTWFIWLNSLGVFGLAKSGMLPAGLGNIALFVAILPAIGILLFSEREGGWGARFGMGFYNLFSTVFYVGDVLSYIRLMALGMVTGGFGMAINQITQQTMDVPYVGWLIGGLIFVGGHLFNIANSALGSFVHSMRLQFVEFFTKFIIGGGKEFEPLQKKYSHVQIKEEQGA